MRTDAYPDWKRGLKVGLIVGVVAGAFLFGCCYLIAGMPAVTDVSPCWGFRPWWRLSNWITSLGFAAVSFVIAAVLVALQPRRSPHSE